MLAAFSGLTTDPRLRFVALTLALGRPPLSALAAMAAGFCPPPSKVPLWDNGSHRASPRAGRLGSGVGCQTLAVVSLVRGVVFRGESREHICFLEAPPCPSTKARWPRTRTSAMTPALSSVTAPARLETGGVPRTIENSELVVKDHPTRRHAAALRARSALVAACAGAAVLCT
jgi:hypothetical protein